MFEKEELDIWTIRSQDDENALESLSLSRRSSDRDKRYLLRFCNQDLDHCVNKYSIKDGSKEVKGVSMRIRSLNQTLEGIYTPVLDIRDRAKLKIKCPDNEKVEKLFLKLISGIYHSNLDYIKGDVLEHCGKDHFVEIKGMDFPIILEDLVPADIIGFFKKYLNK